MGFFDWFDKQHTGEVIRDYGQVHDADIGIVSLQTSLLLSRRCGKLQIVLKAKGDALGDSAQYMYIDVTPETLPKLRAILLDAQRELEKQ